MRSQVVADEIWKETNAGKLAVFALDRREAQHVITITATWARKLDVAFFLAHEWYELR